MNELTAQGMQSLILDLRGNPGGLLPQAVSVADVFLRRDQKIVAVRGRPGYSGEEAREYRAKNTAPFEKPVVVLIDRNSAQLLKSLPALCKIMIVRSSLANQVSAKG